MQQRFEFAPGGAGRDAGMAVLIAVPDIFGPLEEIRGLSGEQGFESYVPSGQINIGRERNGSPLEERFALHKSLTEGDERWADRPVSGRSECLLASRRSAGLPAEGDLEAIPASTHYVVACRSLDDDGSVGHLTLRLSLNDPDWTAAFDERVMQMVRAIELAPLRALPPTTPIEGSVSGRDESQGYVAVRYTPHPAAGPVLEDRVDFNLVSGGRAIPVARGRVIGADATSVFVEMVEGRASLRMNATIAASGSPLRGDEAFGFRGAGLSPGGVDGVFQMLLPPNALPHLDERDAGSWKADSLWDIHGFRRPADVPTPTGRNPRWIWKVSGYTTPSSNSLQDSYRRADDFERRVYCDESMPCPYVYREVRLQGAATCMGASYNRMRQGEVQSRRWHWVCQTGGRSYYLKFERYAQYMAADDNESVERMVKSFAPAR